MLEINKAVFGYTGKNKRKTVLENVSFSLDKGELLCILGANGVGKTTMYRTILGWQRHKADPERTAGEAHSVRSSVPYTAVCIFGI